MSPLSPALFSSPLPLPYSLNRQISEAPLNSKKYSRGSKRSFSNISSATVWPSAAFTSANGSCVSLISVLFSHRFSPIIFSSSPLTTSRNFTKGQASQQFAWMSRELKTANRKSNNENHEKHISRPFSCSMAESFEVAIIS